MSNKYAPIVLFVYNRLSHTKRTVEALKRNTSALEHELFIFSDGPKKGDEDKVKQLREYLATIEGFKTITIVKRQKNKGLANSVIEGVTQIVNKYGKVIVLEDDIVSAPEFLNYMDEALLYYEQYKSVYAVTGYSFLDDKEKRDVPDTYLLPIISSWSWATWKDRWDEFDARANGYTKLCRDKELRRKFNYDDSYDWASMLEAQMKNRYMFWRTRRKKIDSWAIRWYWTLFKHNGLSVFPRDSLVLNIGMDGTGTHCGVIEKERSQFSDEMLCTKEFIFEKNIQENGNIRNKVIRSLKNRG